MAVAIEDAGFEIRDSVAELFDNSPYAEAFLASLSPEQRQLMDRAFPGDGLMAWAYGTGFPKGKGNLKPAYEPIILARKPGPRVLPLGIDECRVPSIEPVQRAAGSCGFGAEREDNYELGTGRQYGESGRYPANLLHDGSEQVLDAFAAFGGKGQLGPDYIRGSALGRMNDDGWQSKPTPAIGYCDSGTAARFFWSPKASRKERGESNNHPTVKPLSLISYLVKLVTPPGGLCLDPFVGSGTTLLACLDAGRRGTGIERDAGHCGIARDRLSGPGARSQSGRQGVLALCSSPPPTSPPPS
jgi:adenine-specific DNA-methyltransferase